MHAHQVANSPGTLRSPKEVIESGSELLGDRDDGPNQEQDLPSKLARMDLTYGFAFLLVGDFAKIPFAATTAATWPRTCLTLRPSRGYRFLHHSSQGPATGYCSLQKVYQLSKHIGRVADCLTTIIAVPLTVDMTITSSIPIGVLGRHLSNSSFLKSKND
jgi:hypothetical protein